MSEQFHYYAAHGLGWATADSKEAAIERLLLKNNTDPTWCRNCLKAGDFLTVFVCRVPLPATAPYKVEWYVPQVDGITEASNHIVTYLTKTKCATTPDLNDKIKVLTRDAKLLQATIDTHQRTIDSLCDQMEDKS